MSEKSLRPGIGINAWGRRRNSRALETRLTPVVVPGHDVSAAWRLMTLSAVNNTDSIDE